MPSDNDAISITPLGDTALLVRCELADPTGAANCREQLASGLLPGVHDIVTAFDVLGVYFDPAKVDHGTVAEWVRRQLAETSTQRVEHVRTIELPVCYAEAYAPDLDRVARLAGLSSAEVVRRHQAVEYTVGAIGFQPGFPYLLGLPQELQTARLATPRTAVPAGAVGIGGRYTGVYPHASPGGWNVIGRTPLRLFDSQRTPASLLAVGDRVRFDAIDESTFNAKCVAESSPQPHDCRGKPVLRILSGDASCRVTQAPTQGQQHLGVNPGGPMDRVSDRLANAIAGSADDNATLEVALNGPVLEAIEDVTVGVAGALPPELAGPTRLHMRRGDTLDLRQLVGGCRCYLSVFGGLSGKRDDTLVTHSPRAPKDHGRRWSLNHRATPATDSDGRVTIRVVAGPHQDRFSTEAIEAFFGGTYRVSARSDRTGVRLEGPAAQASAAEQLQSLPIVEGAIQVPSDGQPIVLGPDRYTLGGYPIIAAAISTDWPVLAQLRPGDTLCFHQVSLQQAEAARRVADDNLHHLLTLLSLRTPP